MIMVRRRARPAKEPVGSGASAASSLSTQNPSNAEEGDCGGNGTSAAALLNAVVALTDDQYFASPKRKDCRLMKANENNLKATEMVAIVRAGGTTTGSKTKVNQMNGKATKSERAVGVPLATRSQTRTIENFFKANAAAKYANLNANATNNAKMTPNQTIEEQKTISLTTTVTTTTTTETTESVEDLQHDEDILLYEETHSLTTSSASSPQFLVVNEAELDEDEETASSEGTLQEDEAVQACPADFQTHRSTLRDSHSSSSSAATDNIFLQEPVLTLDIDRTPSKANSIKINKSFELATAVFSSPPSALANNNPASLLNGRFNQIVSLHGGQSEPQPVNFGAQPAVLQNGFELDHLADSSSCDSGVACSLITNTLTNGESPAAAASGNRRRKPATPHRILCPSPVKTMPRDPVLLQGARKMAAAKTGGEGLSPRKSPRKLAAAAAVCKSRRRLNPNPKPQAPYQTSSKVSDSQAVTTPNAANNDDDDATGVVVILDDDSDDDDDDVHALLKAAGELENLNKARTANNNNNNIKGIIKPPSAATVQAKKVVNGRNARSKSKTPLPLAATNGNRELTDFFPVRRSVRKTKTAVKEEMMRNLEQAVLEERCEGLQVRHFEGKGRGVVADRHFSRNEFVVEYVGDLIAISEATERERRYALDENAGCYMYYFKHKNQQYCIDATVDTGKLGRLINHSRNGNLMTKVVVIKQRPHLVLLAKDDIEPGEELTYDYGDRSKEALLHHPWLAF